MDLIEVSREMDSSPSSMKSFKEATDVDNSNLKQKLHVWGNFELKYKILKF